MTIALEARQRIGLMKRDCVSILRGKRINDLIRLFYKQRVSHLADPLLWSMLKTTEDLHM